jgi:hypothetical protein
MRQRGRPNVNLKSAKRFSKLYSHLNERQGKANESPREMLPKLPI